MNKNKPTDDIELQLRNEGYKHIIGIDEAGRGPLMGPVVAAGVYIPDGFDTSEIKDSKKLSAKKREYLCNKITFGCYSAITKVDQKMIDEINILEATKLAMRNVIYLMREADYAIIDGNFIPSNIDIPAKAVIGGDNLSVSIAAASIVAKVIRDEMVMKMHKEFPIYGWDTNKGYGTKKHMEAIKIYGPSIYHRKTFGRVREYVRKNS